MENTWILRTQRAVGYREEVLEFLARVREQIATCSPLHASVVTRLWLAADELDSVVCDLLGQLNESLVGGEGEVETTRGASMPQEQRVEPDAPEAQGPVYQCTWSLSWDQGRKGVSLVLTAGARDGPLTASVTSRSARARRDLPHPPGDGALEEALGEVFVEESTAEQMMDHLQSLEEELIAEEAALQRAAGVLPEPPEEEVSSNLMDGETQPRTNWGH
jgi:hypothetical protein